MWPNPEETADLANLLKKSLMENFIFCAVHVFWRCLIWISKNYFHYSLLFFTHKRTGSQSKENLEEKWHHIHCAIETSGELERLIKSANNEKENPLLALKRGGAYRTAVNFSYLENNHTIILIFSRNTPKR